MKPVFQTIVDKGRGDCMRAATATLFDLEIEQVPHFILFGENYFQLFWDFVRFLGHDYDGCGYPNCKQDVTDKYGIPNKPKIEDSVNGYFYAVVPSKTFQGVTHAVVMDVDGLVVHDPNPNGLYQGVNIIESKELKYWFLLGKRED